MKKKNQTQKQKKIKIERTPEERAARRTGRKRVYTRILDILCIISGTFFVTIYIPYFFWHITKGHLIDTLAAVLVFIGVLLPFSLRKPLRKWLKKAYTPLKSVWCFAMVFYMVTFSIFCLYIIGHEDAQIPENDGQKVVIVFGCQVYSENSLSIELKARLNQAAEVLDCYPDALCIVSGGQGNDEPVSEAYAMKKYLVEKKNTDENRILEEDHSTSTNENVRFSLEKLKTAGYDPEECTLICISNNYHTPRILWLLDRQGINDAVTVSAPTPYLFNQYIYTVREYMSYIYLLIFG